MMKAYENGANRLWVLNVGDIKPLEYNIQLFMDMAYKTTAFRQSGYTKYHLQEWVGKIFGNEKAGAITSLLWEYYNLAFERRPEFMGWSQTEPTTPTNYTEFNHFYYGDEAQKRMDRYNALEQAVKKLRTKISRETANAFYQLVYYPVVGASEMNKKFLYRDKAFLYSKQNRLSAYDYSQLSKDAYDSIVKETEDYNRQANGKWNKMMSMKPRELPVYQEPLIPAIHIDSTTAWSIAPEGFVTKDSSLLKNTTSMTLPSFDNLNKQKYFIDVFLSKDQSVSWTASVSENWIRLSKKSGMLRPKMGEREERIWVDVDWSEMKQLDKTAGTINFSADGQQMVVIVAARNINKQELTGYKGFVENNGLVSMEAAHFTRQTNRSSGQWAIVHDLGYAGNAVEALPHSITVKPLTNPDSIKKNNAFVEYDFITFSSAIPFVTVFSLPTHPINDNFSVRYAMSIDDGPLKTVDIKTVSRSEEWKQNVLRNRAERKIEMPLLVEGKHSLKIYCIDPGVILDEIRIDLGGLKKAYSSIRETKQRLQARAAF
jgi:hypothetical protein